MERALTLSARPPWLRIAFARLHHAIGWAGLAGIASLVLTAAAAYVAWERKAELANALAVARAMPSPAVARPAAETTSVLPRLPSRTDIPLLLARIERAVTQSGLPWSAGDYRISAATDRQPAVLEVRCAFKAPYPKLRAMLVDLLGTVPMATFREMSFTREDIRSLDVDARFAIAVFLADEPPPVKGAP